jgi:transposase-like protein
MQRLAAKPHRPDLPEGQLVLIADALRLTRRRQEWAVYDMAVKPANLNSAFLLDPVLLAGRESAQCWRQVIDGIAPAIRQRVKALVSDGLPGAETICCENGWVHQRCHFHILVAFAGSRNRLRRVRTLLRKVRDVVCQSVRLAIGTADPDRLLIALSTLQVLIPMVPKRAQRLPGVIRQFIADIDAFRTYRAHPELGLPTTTGVIESLHSRIRAVTNRIHSPVAIARRAACLVRLRPAMTCNSNSSIHQQH